jgi:hypothetical protein
VTFTNLAPRLDTFPIYGTSGETVLPGYAVYDKLPVMYLHSDIYPRLFKIKNFACYAGIGILIGKTTVKEAYAIETQVIQTMGSIDHLFAGVRGGLQATYTVKKRFIISVEATHNAVSSQDWSLFLSHRTLGLGIAYNFRTAEE